MFILRLTCAFTVGRRSGNYDLPGYRERQRFTNTDIGGMDLKLVCRKCNIEFPCETLDDVREIQTMTCGADGGVHMLVGLKK